MLLRHQVTTYEACKKLAHAQGWMRALMRLKGSPCWNRACGRASAFWALALSSLNPLSITDLTPWYLEDTDVRFSLMPAASGLVHAGIAMIELPQPLHRQSITFLNFDKSPEGSKVQGLCMFFDPSKVASGWSTTSSKGAQRLRKCPDYNAHTFCWSFPFICQSSCCPPACIGQDVQLTEAHIIADASESDI